MYFIIDMNLPGFDVPTTLAHRQPSANDMENYNKELNKWRAVKDAPEETKPERPKTVIASSAMVTHDILKTALQMAFPEGNPEQLRRLQKIHKAIEEGLDNNGQLNLSQEDHRFLQSKYAKADKWNTNPDVCKTVIAIQDAISRAAMVTTK